LLSILATGLSPAQFRGLKDAARKAARKVGDAARDGAAAAKNKTSSPQEKTAPANPSSPQQPSERTAEGARPENAGKPPNQRVQINGQWLTEGSIFVVAIPDGLNSATVHTGDIIRAFVPARLPPTGGPAASLRILRLAAPATPAGYADVEVLLESIDNNGSILTPPRSVVRLLTSELDRAAADPQASSSKHGPTKASRGPAQRAKSTNAGTSELEAAQEVADIFGAGEKIAVHLPAMSTLSFRIGATSIAAPPSSPDSRTNSERQRHSK
jgi:hypothetical protein